MKIKKIAQPVPQQGQAEQAQSPDQQGQQQTGEQFQQAMDPKLRTVFMKSLQGTGLSKQKVLPFLEQLFTGLGDIPLSKVTGLLKALQNDPSVQ